MKTRDTAHAARKRLVTGIIILGCTFFYAFASTCGLLGRLIARGSAELLGQTGSLLLALTMFVVAVALIMPVGAIGRVVRWALHGRDARVRGVVREMETALSKSEMRKIVKMLREEMQDDDKDGVPEPIAPAPGEPVPVPPADRMKLEEVSGALKMLGYKPHEYTAIVKTMDPSRSHDNLIRDALNVLRGKSQSGARAN